MGDLRRGLIRCVSKNALYRCLDKVLPHKTALLSQPEAPMAGSVRRQLRRFAVRRDAPTFESEPPDDETDKRRHGTAATSASDCVQVVIARSWTPEGFPLALKSVRQYRGQHDVADFCRKIETQYGKAQRYGSWTVALGPTKSGQMRQSDPPIWDLWPRQEKCCPEWRKLC